MSNVFVTLTGNINSVVYIDLESDPWKKLHENYLPPFSLIETKRPCLVYGDGIFPGAQQSNKIDEQITKILKFPNYIEFSKVMLKDTKLNADNERQLTARFYEKRHIGWTSQNILKKEGEVIGFNINGDIHHVSDARKVYGIFYRVVYGPLVKDLIEFQNLKKMLKEGKCLQLSGGSDEFLNGLAKIVMSDN